MRDTHSRWIFEIGLKLAVAMCLFTLAVALFVGVSPLIAIFRSAVAFVVFLTLAWAAALLWKSPEPEEEEAEAGDSESEENEGDETPDSQTETQQQFQAQPAPSAVSAQSQVEDQPLPVG